MYTRSSATFTHAIHLPEEEVPTTALLSNRPSNTYDSHLFMDSPMTKVSESSKRRHAKVLILAGSRESTQRALSREMRWNLVRKEKRVKGRGEGEEAWGGEGVKVKWGRRRSWRFRFHFFFSTLTPPSMIANMFCHLCEEGPSSYL